ncbi:hypothetical protein [Pelagibacterium sediminicola]|uniref:hypothetical protein n=1 Tax=Pelagibacterium sediminicola TaxID=2248761 RepID=UPI000E319B94|nr:hypothetical protein [Pelagibacterium sediminicola]
MEDEGSERFITEATSLAEAFIDGLSAMFDELSDDEVRHLTEIVAERLAFAPEDPVRQIIVDEVNEEYGRRFCTDKGQTDPETLMEF